MPPFEDRILNLERKVLAGARFIQTQFCFDVRVLSNFMRAVRARELHRRASIIVGVGTLSSAKALRRMAERVPGVHVPGEVLRRVAGAADQKSEAKRICLETIDAVRQIEGVAGIHLIGHRNDATIIEIIRESGVREGNVLRVREDQDRRPKLNYSGAQAQSAVGRSDQSRPTNPLAGTIERGRDAVQQGRPASTFRDPPMPAENVDSIDALFLLNTIQIVEQRDYLTCCVFFSPDRHFAASMRLELRAPIDHCVYLFDGQYTTVCPCQHSQIWRVVFQTWRMDSTAFGIDAVTADATILVLKPAVVSILLSERRSADNKCSDEDEDAQGGYHA